MIYILDGAGLPVGPFKDPEDVKRFIEMMALCGEYWVDHKIVEADEDDAPWQIPVRMDSKARRVKSDRSLNLVGRRKP